MIAKAHGGGASFGGVAAYCLKLDRETQAAEQEERGGRVADAERLTASERVEWTDTRNLATTDVRTAARQMGATAQYADELKKLAGVSTAGRKLTKPVYHYTLSWDRDERPDRMEMSRAVDESLRALGMEDRQAFVAAHNDTDHSHVHVVVNRVSYEDGRAVGRGNDRLKLSRWAERWEREHGGIRCQRRAVNNGRREAGEWVVDEKAAAYARYHRPMAEQIERRPAARWRPGQNVVDAVLKRVHEREAWEETQSVLAVLRDAADRGQRREWSELLGRQERERDAGGGEMESEMEMDARHRRERVELGRRHGGESRELEETAARKYQEAVEAPIRADDLDRDQIAAELGRMRTELSGESAVAFGRALQGRAREPTLEIDRGRDRGGFSR